MFQEWKNSCDDGAEQVGALRRVAQRAAASSAPWSCGVPCRRRRPTAGSRRGRCRCRSYCGSLAEDAHLLAHDLPDVARVGDRARRRSPRGAGRCGWCPLGRLAGHRPAPQREVAHLGRPVHEVGQVRAPSRRRESRPGTSCVATRQPLPVGGVKRTATGRSPARAPTSTSPAC